MAHAGGTPKARGDKGHATSLGLSKAVTWRSWVTSEELQLPCGSRRYTQHGVIARMGTRKLSRIGKQIEDPNFFCFPVDQHKGEPVSLQMTSSQHQVTKLHKTSSKRPEL